MFAEKELKGVRVFSFSELSRLPHFIFAVSSRQTDSDVGHTSATEDLDKKRRLSHALNIDSNNLFTLRQVHSARTVVLEESMLGREERELGPADGIIVTEPGLFAAVRTADCMPVVAVYPKGKQVALFHMGWRGAKERILERGLREFFNLSGADPGEIMAGLGPCIRSCCYEVGDEVREAFKIAQFRLEEVLLGRYLDLVAVAKAQLTECGVKSFLDSGLCTACRTDLFYSYRREATNSRMWTLAGFTR
jgi:YfiH family protein